MGRVQGPGLVLDAGAGADTGAQGCWEWGPGLETWHLCPSLRCRESLLCQSFLFAETFFKQIFSSLHTNGVAAFCPL